MSYSVLIVDDDNRVRSGLIKNIEWEQLGFEAPFQADSSAKALSVFSTNHIDVLISDIRMPGGSGLELCKQVSVLYPQTVILLLSGYSDFEYAQKAIQYGVKHYLTKPTDLMELRNVLKDVKELLDTKLKAATNAKKRDERYTQAIERLTEQFCVDISYGTIRNDHSLKEFLEENNILFPHPFYCVASVKPSDEKTFCNDQYILDLLKNFIKLQFKNHDLVFYLFHMNDYSVHILSNYSEQAVFNQAVQKLYENCSVMLKTDAIITVSGSVTDLGMVSECYNQVRNLSASNNKPGIYRYRYENDLQDKETLPDPSYVKEIENQLLSYISSCEEEKAYTLVHVLFSGFDSDKKQAEFYQELFLRLLLAIEEHISFFNIKLSDLLGDRLFMHKKINTSLDVLEIVADLKNCIYLVIDAIKQSQSSFLHKLVERIKQYIEANYSDNITLYTASEHVNLSPSYISKIFKKCTGYNFIDFLTDIRIKKAKEFLAETDIKVYQVSEMVGYKSTKHFSQVFKSSVGMTPLSFKKSVLHKLN